MAMDASSQRGARSPRRASTSRPRRGGSGPRHRRRESQPQAVYWLRRIAAVVVVLLLVWGAVRACGMFSEGPGSQSDQHTEQQAPQDPPERAPAPEDIHVDADIPVSQPVEMVVPNLGIDAEFEGGSCRVVDGAINPATRDLACAYTADGRPYSLPGTDAGDIVVIAGHTGLGVSGVFDRLYNGREDKHNVSLGDDLYVRTQDSGDLWLKYTATDLHDPEKQGLPDSTDIWGEGPMPGRLLTISCIQPANPFAPSVRNAVVGWQFSEVVQRTE